MYICTYIYLLKHLCIQEFRASFNSDGKDHRDFSSQSYLDWQVGDSCFILFQKQVALGET